MDVRGEWFYQQHFTEEELEQIHAWNTSIGRKAHAILLPSGMYGGYHQADKEKSLLLVSMAEKSMVDNWLIRLGFNKVYKPEPPPSLKDPSGEEVPAVKK